jgi:HSP20 family protein
MNTITRWAPINDVMSLRNTMNQLFEESLTSNRSKTQSYVPALNLSETADNYTIELVVPGITAEQLEITFENNVLSIAGTIERPEQVEGQTYHRIERRYGQFRRSISLPNSVQGDAISAKLENGILQLNVPKAEAIKPRRIDIQIS